MRNGIYGTGAYGSLLWDWCRNMGIQIDFFAQTQEPVGTEIHGLRILSIDDVLKLQGETKLLLALKDAAATEEVRDTFVRSGTENIQVYDMRSFIEDNLARGDALSPVTGDKYCVICQNSPQVFEPAGMRQALFQSHHIIGGGYRENCICPLCGCSDRERWLYYVITRLTDIPALKGRVLHFAPEKSISELLRSYGNIDYYTGDLASSRAMHVTDITDIQYRDETFDYVICNHVMEHIPDEERAVSEIMRVMKKDGKWLFSFPICTDMDTLEDPAIASPEDRLRKYGQEDHVRLYGRDFMEHFERYGLRLQVYRPHSILSRQDIAKYGFIEDDVTIIAEKRS